jgi:hypothetical protein
VTLKRSKRAAGKRRDKGSARNSLTRVGAPASAAGATETKHAETAASADTTGAAIVWEFSTLWLGDVSIEGLFDVIRAKVNAAERNDLRDVDQLLMAQAVALNSMFAGLVQLARKNLADHFDGAERLMRLGLKAQSQSRATLETLAAIKNPPTVFARQANVAQGPQQVNNVVAVAGSALAAHARAGNSESEPIELLEAHGERLDACTAETAITGNQAMAPMGTRHRTENG